MNAAVLGMPSPSRPRNSSTADAYFEKTPPLSSSRPALTCFVHRRVLAAARRPRCPRRRPVQPGQTGHSRRLQRRSPGGDAEGAWWDGFRASLGTLKLLSGLSRRSVKDSPSTWQALLKYAAIHIMPHHQARLAPACPSPAHEHPAVTTASPARARVRILALPPPPSCVL